MAKKLSKQKLDELRVDRLMENVDFFEPVDIKKTPIPSFTKAQFLILIKELNRSMVLSTNNWEGG